MTKLEEQMKLPRRQLFAPASQPAHGLSNKAALKKAERQAKAMEALMSVTPKRNARNAVTPKRNANAERQARYRARKKARP